MKTTVVLIFVIGVSWNTKCDNSVGFPKLGHIYVSLAISDQSHGFMDKTSRYV